MDDCNGLPLAAVKQHYDVQIPLWTIVTPLPGYLAKRERCSDSSMDDCNMQPNSLTSWSFLCSDSSMDDCN